ncbi:MAG: hypothetical protein HY775_07230 [Acidobacteria bacterium]|nr:hypothetical protein [Acidobacteriota bacterium]
MTGRGIPDSRGGPSPAAAPHPSSLLRLELVQFGLKLPFLRAQPFPLGA